MSKNKNDQNIIVKRLKENNASIDIVDNNGETPLFNAIRGGHIEMVRFLLELYGDISNTFNNNGISPLHFAVLEGASSGIIELLSIRYRWTNTSISCY